MIIVLIIGQIVLSGSQIYDPEQGQLVGPVQLSNRALCYIRVVDDLKKPVLDVKLKIEPLNKSYQLRDGRTRLSMRPGVYTFKFSKEDYQRAEKTIALHSDRIGVVDVTMAMDAEIRERRRWQAKHVKML